MSIIHVKYDNVLQQTPIEIPIIATSESETPNTYSGNMRDIRQTMVYGVQTPLIMINKIIIDINSIISFELSNYNRLPTVKLTVIDRYSLISMLDRPGLDNELRIQILPKAEGKYKKIDLTFYITNSTISEKIISINGHYKLQDLERERLESLGKISTYDLCDYIASNTGLGFATNVIENSFDDRYIYCNDKSYLDILNQEISQSGSSNHIFDYWVDLWNNITLVDIREQYYNVDKPEDMQVWVTHQQLNVDEFTETEAIQMSADLHNLHTLSSSDLYITKCINDNMTSGNVLYGTDRTYYSYNTSISDFECNMDFNEDVKNDLYIKRSYLGESYGDYNYLLAKAKRNFFMNKIDAGEKLTVTLRSPNLGIIRGGKVNLYWYYVNSETDRIQEELQEVGASDINTIHSNIEFPEGGDPDSNATGQFTLDKSRSGQYLVYGCKILWNKNIGWEYVLSLVRPSSSKPDIIK